MNDLRKHCLYSILDESNFVGIKFFDKDFKIIFPLGYRLDENISKDALITEIRKLVQTINITRKHYPDKLSNSYSEDNCSVFDSMFSIIEDYLINGLFNIKTREITKSQHGKIYWKKTIHSKTLINEDDLFFKSIFYQSSNFQENLITRIEVHCLYIAKTSLYFLFNNFSLPKDTIIDAVSYIPYLKQVLSRTYNDHDKTLLQIMISIILNSKSNILNSSRDIGTESYFAVWEYMILQVYGNNEDIKKYYPNSMYHLNEQNEDFSNSYLRPDVIGEQNNQLYIFDAKYYKYGETYNNNDLPESSSIQKQVYYGEYILKKFSKDSINAFVLPYKSTSSSGVKNIGYAYLDNDKDKSKFTYRRVEIILKDTKSLIDDFLEGNKADDLFI